MTDTAPPGATGAWYFVALLTLLNAVSYLDRHSIALLAEPISAALNLDDAEIALVIGAGFAVVYALVSLPLSHFIDRWNRTRMVVVAALIWSGATIAAAFATGLTSLAVCRAGVALGEAALVPAAVSLIPDLFSFERRVGPTSLFSSIAGIMGKGAFVVGAGLLTLATSMAASVPLAPWQITLILMGALGGLIAMTMLLTVREPTRTTGPTKAASDNATMRLFLAHIGRNWRFYIPLYIGISAAAIFTLGMISWTPTLLVRGHDFTLAQASFTFGVVGMIAGLAGTIAWPTLSAYLRRQNRPDALLISLLASMVILGPFAFLGPGSSSSTTVFIGVAGAQFCLAAIGVLTPLVAQTHGPPAMRARLMSLQLIAMSLVGFTFGPLSVALLAKLWPGNPLALGYGMSVLGAVAVPTALIALTISRRRLLLDPEAVKG